MDGLQDQPIQSILAVDCGSLYTRALLMDVVADEYRFVGSGSAPTTTEAPYADLSIGVYNAIVDLEATTGRRLVQDGRVVTPQHPDGHGVDLFVATCSAAPAVRLVVAGITGAFSTRAARQAAASTATHVLGTISLDEPVSRPGLQGLTRKGPAPASTWADTQYEKLLAFAPDVVLLTGGVEGGPVAPLLRLAGVVVRSIQEHRRREKQAALVGGTIAPPPLLFFAGNSAALHRVQAALGDAAAMVALPNIQPALDTIHAEPVREALSGLVRQKQMQTLPGLDALRTWTQREIEPTLHAVELVTRYISAQYHREVLTADVGATSTMLSLSGGTDGDRHVTAVRGDFGLGYGLANLLAAAGPAAVMRWLPFECTAGEVQDWALNRLLRPWTLAQTARDLAIEHAFAREALRTTLGDLQGGRDLPAAGYDLLIGTGGLLAHAPRVGQAAMVLLDALEPTGEGVGSLELALDSTLMMPALGALAAVHPGAAAYLFDRDCLVLLGTCVVPLPATPPVAGGTPPIAVQVTVEYAEAGTISIEVPYGSIEVIPLRPEQRASLRVKPGAGFRIGNDEPGKQVQTKPGEEIKGGLIGLIIDARGRPLVLPEDREARIAKLLEWGQALRAYSTRETFGALPEPATLPPAPTPVVPVATPADGGVPGSPLESGSEPVSPGPGAGGPGLVEVIAPASDPVPGPGPAPLAPGSAPREGRRLNGRLNLPSMSRTQESARPPESSEEVAGDEPPADTPILPRMGRLHLPSVGDSSRHSDTAPPEWPSKEEE